MDLAKEVLLSSCAMACHTAAQQCACRGPFVVCSACGCYERVWRDTRCRGCYDRDLVVRVQRHATSLVQVPG